MLDRVGFERSLSANRTFDVSLRHLVLFREGVTEDRQMSTVKEVENPVVDAAFPYSKLVDAFSQEVRQRPP